MIWISGRGQEEAGATIDIDIQGCVSYGTREAHAAGDDGEGSTFGYLALLIGISTLQYIGDFREKSWFFIKEVQNRRSTTRGAERTIDLYSIGEIKEKRHAVEIRSR